MPEGKSHTGPGDSERILFAGIGNLLRSDDGVGVMLCRKIIPSESRQILLAEMSIENYIGKINRLAPEKLILVDCVDFGRRPGYWKFLPVEELKETTFHTHHISLKTVSELFDMPVWILGIQPRSLEFGESLSPDVQATADHLAEIINASGGSGCFEELEAATCLENL
ncbi:MAG: hydrogenase maturation protease [Bacteroidales bacterium]